MSCREVCLSDWKDWLGSLAMERPRPSVACCPATLPFLVCYRRGGLLAAAAGNDQRLDCERLRPLATSETYVTSYSSSSRPMATARRWRCSSPLSPSSFLSFSVPKNAIIAAATFAVFFSDLSQNLHRFVACVRSQSRILAFNYSNCASDNIGLFYVVLHRLVHPDLCSVRPHLTSLLWSEQTDHKKEGSY